MNTRNIKILSVIMVTLLATSLCNDIFAQARAGIKGGLNVSNLYIDKDHLKSFDYGLAGGFGLNFGAVQVGARYNYGLVKIADSDAAELFLGDSKNSVAQLYLSLNLNSKRNSTE